MNSARDQQTLGFYAAEVETYSTRGAMASSHLEGFLKRLHPGSRILELGCGAGQDSEAMIAKGFDVQPTDGTPEMAQAAAKRLGKAVRTLLFDDINDLDTYDGIWANACLLHVPRSGLGDVIERIHAALKTGGIFYASFKSGDAEGRDQFDRFYNYPSKDWLLGVYATCPWASISFEEAEGGGYDRKPTNWLHVTAAKP